MTASPPSAPASQPIATLWRWLVLAGVLIALPRPTSCRPATRTGIIGGGLAYFAVGCPTCNHLVVLALGTTGALAWFAPIQPYLALIALAVLVGAIVHRLWLLRAVRGSEKHRSQRHCWRG